MYVQPVLLGIRKLPVSLQTELIINTNVMVADMHRNALTGQENVSGRNGPVSDLLSVTNRMLTVV